MQRSSQSSSTDIPKPPPPPPIQKKQSSEQDSKTILPVSETKTLPVLRSDILQIGELVKEDKEITLHTGVYDERPVAIQRMSAEAWAQHQESWTALYQCRSPFWLPLLGTCEQSEKRMIVLASLPETQWNGFLISPSAETWTVRCRIVRDVAVGLYQCRVAGATHIAWSLEQLSLDPQGRAQILPGLSETPVAETDDVFALAQLLWCMVSRSITLVTGWQQGKGLPRNCPPAVMALIQACTNPTVSARPSLKALAKGLDVFWQRAEQGFSDALPVLLPVRSSVKEKKVSVPIDRSPVSPAYQVNDLLTGSPLADIKLTGSMPAPVLADFQAEDKSEQSSRSASSSSSSSSTTSQTTSVSQSVLDSVVASGSLNLLLIDDQTVSWLNPTTDVRYQVGLKIGALRDSVAQPIESKASLPALQQEIQHTLIESNIEMLLWLGEEGEDPSHCLQETAWRLWQTSQWKAYRPGDPPPSTWLSLLIHFHQGVSSPLLIRAHQPPEGVTDFTESEWQLLRSQYAVFWLVQGIGQLEAPSNLYDSNELHQLGRTRLCVHSIKPVAFKQEESTYFMPHGVGGQLLPARYARYATDPACDFNTWEGRYPGKIGLEAQEVTPAPIIALTPAKDLVLNRNQLILDEKTTLGKGAFGEVLRGTYYGQPVAVKRFKEAKLSSSDQAQLKDEAAVMANLRSPFLIQSLGLSLESPPLLVMELAEGGSLYTMLKDDRQELPWVWRLRVLRDIALGLSVLHAHELLHRDLKSFNILLDAEGRAKLCDFGLSTLKSQGGENLGAGTPLWNAPEVLQGQAATPASDVYSLAIIVWEMVTRRLPYCYPGTQKISHSDWKDQVNQGYREAIPSDCPPALAQVISAGWAQDPEDRPSAAAVAQVLEHLWQEAVAAEQPPPSLMRQTRIGSVHPDLKKETIDPDPSSSQGLLSSLLTDRHLRVDLPDKKESKSPAPLTTGSETPSSVLTPPAESKAARQAFALLLSQSPMPHWQDKLSPQYTLGVKLQRLQQAVLADLHITQELSCYVAPNGQSQPGQPSDPLYPWIERELLRGEARVLVLLGLAGAGKSTFNRFLLRTLGQNSAWQTYRPGDPLPDTLLPIWIPLGSSQVKHDDLWGYLQQYGFIHAEIVVLQRQARMIFITDGYDEIPGVVAPNLFDLNFREDKNVKLIIGCRNQRLHTLSEADAFVPHPTVGGLPNWMRYRSRYVAPFTPQQTEDYIEKYVAQHQHDPDRPKDWDTVRYKKEFATFPEFQTLIDTPFMLWMTLSILPQLTSDQVAQPKGEPDKDIKENKTPKPIRTKITRAALYDRFMDIWFSRQAKKAWQQRSFLENPTAILGRALMQALKVGASQTGSEDVQVYWLKSSYRLYCLRLAEQLTLAGKVSLSLPQDQETKETKQSCQGSTDWLTLLLDDSPDSQCLRQGCPLREDSDHNWGFMHGSLLDYFMITAIEESLLSKSKESSSLGSFSLTYVQAVALLMRLHLSADQIEFFVDRVEGKSKLQESLFKIIELSKVDKNVGIASANAATILHWSGANLFGRDWRGVQLPGADLRGAIFANVNLLGANLKGVKLTNAMLYGTNVENANLEDLDMGGREYKAEISNTHHRLHHPIHPWVAEIQAKGTVRIFHQDSDELLKELVCPLELYGEMKKIIVSPIVNDIRVIFSQDGNLIAAAWVANRDLTQKEYTAACMAESGLSSGPIENYNGSLYRSIINIWSMSNYELISAILIEEDGDGNAHLLFSPDNRLIAFSGEEGVRLFNVKSGDLLIGEASGRLHRAEYWSFSPDSSMLAFESEDHSIQLWYINNLHTSAETLAGHKDQVIGLVFHPNSRLLASWSKSGPLWLWELDGLQANGKFLADAISVSCAAFSRDGRLLVTTIGTMIKLWDILNRSLLSEVAGFEGVEISFNSDGDLLIFDNKRNYRLWKLDSLFQHSKLLVEKNTFQIHTAISPTGRLWVSEEDSVIKVRDINNHSIVAEFFISRESQVTTFCFSPDEKLLISRSDDKKIRFWDLSNQILLGEVVEDKYGIITFSSDGLLLATVPRCSEQYGTCEEEINLWNVNKRELIYALPKLFNSVTVHEIAFNSNKLLAICAVDHYDLTPEGVKGIRLWDIRSRRFLKEPWLEKRLGVGIVFTPDSRILAFIRMCNDNVVDLWHMRNKQLLGQLTCGGMEVGGIRNIVFSSDGKLLAFVGCSAVYLWDIDTQSFLGIIDLKWRQSDIALVAFQSIQTQTQTPISIFIKDYKLVVIDQKGLISYWSISVTKKAKTGMVEWSPPRLLNLSRPVRSLALVTTYSLLFGSQIHPNTKQLLEKCDAGSQLSQRDSQMESKVHPLPPKARSPLSSVFTSLFNLHSDSTHKLLNQAEQLIEEIYPSQLSGNTVREGCLAKLKYYREQIDTLSLDEQGGIKKWVKALCSLRDRQTHLTPSNQKQKLKLAFGFKQRIWSSPKTNPPVTSSSCVSSSSSSSSSALFSSASSTQSASTLSTTTTINPEYDILILD